MNHRSAILAIALAALLGCEKAGAQLPPVPEGNTEGQSEPRLFVAQRVKNLGLLIEGDKVPVQWTLENRGGADLVIDKVKAACGCTVLHLAKDQKIVPAGASLILKAEFDTTRRRGDQAKTITVFSNDAVEPKLKLEFTAEIETLYETIPSSVINLRTVQRGRRASRTLDIIPGKGQNSIEVVVIKLSEDVPLDVHVEPYQVDDATGQRVYFDVKTGAALDRIRGELRLTLRVAGREVQRTMSLRGQVVGDLTWLPHVLDASRQPLTRGKRLAPISLQSANKEGFDVLDVQAGPILAVSFKRERSGQPRSRYRINVAIRDDAPSGPFGEQIEVRTSALDQPIVHIPVFGIVAPPVLIDPPLILLRYDGTPKGKRRRVKIQASTNETLKIGRMFCTSDAVSVEIDREASATYRHLRFLTVKLTKPPPRGTHDFVLTIETNIDGARLLKIPVTITGPQ